MATRVSSPLFIGRQAELHVLVKAVERATAGSASTILIGGDAGIGKSRLVAEISALATNSGALVLEGGCVSLGDGGGLPFAPIVEALRQLPAILGDDPADGADSIEALHSPATAELGRLVPELGSAASPEVGAIDRPEWIQGRIFEGLLTLLRMLGERRPVVLILEDLHWADGSTRDITSFLARNTRRERLVVIGTYRTDELHRRHPLRPWLAEMERLPRVERLGLPRFGREELSALVGAILEHVPPAALLETVERRSEGNPFFVEELLASGAEAHGDRLPATLRDVLLNRITALSEDAQHILGIAAVAGRRVPTDLLAAVSGAPETELEAPLREALASQIVVSETVSGVDAYRFRHALLAEAVYDDLLPSERRRLHAAYAAALEGRDVPGGAEGASHLAALAHHATAAHEQSRALRAWVGAAEAAASAHAFAESMRAYERAIDLWDTVPSDERPDGVDAARLHHEASLGALVSGRPDRAVHFARVAVGLIDQNQEPERWAAANERLSRSCWVAGEMDEAMAILEATAAVLEDSEPTAVRARVVAALAGTQMLLGDHISAMATAQAALVLARLAHSPIAEAHALNTLGASTMLTGATEDGLRIAREAFERTREIPDAFYDVGRGYANLSSALLMAGHAEESLAVATEGVEWAHARGAAGGYGRFVAGNAIGAAIELGRWSEAESMLDELLNTDDSGVNRMATLSAGGTFLARRGRIEDAERVLGEGRSIVAPLVEAQFTAPIYVGLVELAVTAGRVSEATELAEEGVQRLLRTQDRYYVGDLLSIGTRANADLAEVARARRDQDGASAAATTAQGFADRLQAIAAAVGPEAYGGRLQAYAAMATAEAGRATGTADPGAWQAAVKAIGEAPEAWTVVYARYRLAEAILAGHGPRREAEAALASAHVAATGLGAAPLLGWIDALARRARLTIQTTGAAQDAIATDGRPVNGVSALTTREREVLALVTEGYTNRRIAEALFISENTAGVHVSNILGKLDVSSRTEAAAVATRLGLVG